MTLWRIIRKLCLNLQNALSQKKHVLNIWSIFGGRKAFAVPGVNIGKHG